MKEITKKDGFSLFLMTRNCGTLLRRCSSIGNGLSRPVVRDEQGCLTIRQTGSERIFCGHKQSVWIDRSILNLKEENSRNKHSCTYKQMVFHSLIYHSYQFPKIHHKKKGRRLRPFDLTSPFLIKHAWVRMKMLRSGLSSCNRHLNEMSIFLLTVLLYQQTYYPLEAIIHQ